MISEFIHARIRECQSSEPSKIYILAREQAIFKSLFFAVDRAVDLLGLKVVDILPFPDNSGYLINHIWTKSLISGDVNVFAFRSVEKRLEMYFNICRLLTIELKPGYHFRSVTISLALAGVSLHLHEIMDHVGWKNGRTALHYIKGAVTRLCACVAS